MSFRLTVKIKIMKNKNISETYVESAKRLQRKALARAEAKANRVKPMIETYADSARRLEETSKVN
jgi:hypothetical protein